MIEGAYSAKKRVMDFLSADIPTRLIVYRNHWAVSELELPNPVKYLAFEPFAIDEWPTIYTVITSTPSIVRDDFDSNTNPQYEVKYAARTYVWVRSVKEAPTVAMRDRLVAVVRDALLDHPSLYAEGDEVECADALPFIDEGTLREEYSDLSLLKGDRLMAGAYLSYDLIGREVVERPLVFDPDNLGIALSFVLDVFPIPRVPNAPTRVWGIGGPNPGEIIVSWRAATWSGEDGPILGYRIESSDDDGETWGVLVEDTNSTTPMYLLSGLTPGDSFMFRVAAFNGVGVGEFSLPSAVVVATED